jgi:surface antigen
MKPSKFTFIIVTALFLAACQTNGMGQKQKYGTLAGAGIGALAGTHIGKGNLRLASVAIGTLGGAYLGSEIGKSLDRADLIQASRAQKRALKAPIGRTISWNNPTSKNYGSYQTLRDGRDQSSGAYCREYKTTINVGGWEEDGFGTACRQPDGTWKIVS